MYEIPPGAYTKAHLFDLKALWIDAALTTIEQLENEDLEEGGPGNAKPFIANVAEVVLFQDGQLVFAPAPVSLPRLRESLQAQKDKLDAALGGAEGDALFKFEKRGLSMRYRLWRAQIRALLPGLDMSSFFEYPFKLAAAISSFLRNRTWGEVMEKLKNNYIEKLNARPWLTISRPIAGPGNKQFRVDIVPVNSEFDPTFAKWEKTGFASMSPRLTQIDPDKQLRATNLWHSTFTAVDGNKVLFECFRSGTLADPFAQDEGRRETVARSKAKELLQAMAVRHFQKLTPERRTAIVDGNEAVALRAVCCNVQSAAFRGTSDMKEREPTEDHCDALHYYHDLHDQPDHPGNLHKIVVNGAERNVRATFEIAVFNFGVNAVGSPILSIYTGGKSYRKRTNRTGLEVLEGFHRSFKLKREAELEQNTRPAEEVWRELGTAGALIEKIRKHLMSDASYRSVSLITMLGHRLGHFVHFNCKSGKDRTSLVALESHYVAWKIHETGNIPRWTNHLPPGDDKLMHRKLIFESGNLELQRHNTGTPGYKIVPDVKIVGHPFEMPLAERLGKHLVPAQGLCRETEVKSTYVSTKKFGKFIGMSVAKRREFARIIAEDATP